MAVEILQSEIVYKGRVFDIRKDKIRLTEGEAITLDIVEHRGAVTIIPYDDQNQVWFIRQYRHPASRELIELPAGVMDEGETPAESALRELREEIGMTADQLEPLGEFFLAPGYSTEYMHVFLASGLRPAPLQPDEGEYIVIEKIPLDQVPAMVASGAIHDAKSLAALMLWRIKSGK